MVRIWLVLVLVVLAGGVRAELQSLFPRGEDDTDTVTRAGLFAPAGNMGFFAPLPERVRISPLASGTGTTQIDRLLSLIARAEAGSAGYDAVQHGARVRPAALPTQMTLGEIYRWIDDTPGQPHAIGRIWAGLPLPNGRSYYEGHAGNKATMSWAAFDGGMARIWGAGR